jgi:gamma-glutamylaminecyclotransferase
MIQDKEKILVAVYGSLKRGENNHDLLEVVGATFIGSGCTQPNYKLLNFGNYPGAIKGTNCLEVEVYEVSQKVLERLDQLEGHPSFYQRLLVNIKLRATTNPIRAWMYTLDHMSSNYSKSKEYTVKNDLGNIDWTTKQ